MSDLLLKHFKICDFTSYQLCSSMLNFVSHLLRPITISISEDSWYDVKSQILKCFTHKVMKDTTHRLTRPKLALDDRDRPSCNQLTSIKRQVVIVNLRQAQYACGENRRKD